MKHYGNMMIEKLTQTIVDCFETYPLNTHLYKNVTNRDRLLYAFSRMNVQDSIKRKMVHMLDDNPDTVYIGRYGSVSFLQGFMDFSRLLAVSLRLLAWRDFWTLYANHKKVKHVLDLKWHKKAVGKAYYHLMLIAIAEEQRRKGRFRKLLSPLFADCDKQNIPVVLETHNAALVPLYEHIGFTVVKKVESVIIDLVQYCMVRHPQREKKEANGKEVDEKRDT